MADESRTDLLLKIQELQNRLDEAEQLIEAIKAGEVDAFAIPGKEQSEIYTLQSGDYAYRELIEKFGEGALNVTEDGLIVYTNTSFLQLLNRQYEQVVGSLIFDFIQKDSLPEFNKLFKKALEGSSKGEINLVGNELVIPVYVSLTSLQPRLGTIGIIITDLTEKKNHEKIISAYQRDLELKNKDLLRSNTELASFSHIASHDLQEPLRKIQTFSSRILEKDYELLSENGKEYFKRIQAGAKRMQLLIEDLLSYSQTNAAKGKFEETVLNKIFDEVKAELIEEVQKKKATIFVADLGMASIIPFQFRQLFHNLLSNSLKFSSPDRPLRIDVEGMVSDGQHFHSEKLMPDKKYCHIRISDNGIGFQQQYSERIFELFQRLHGKSEYPGTGIGLAIVKKIVENHNGIITARSELNHGAVFDIYIPAE